MDYKEFTEAIRNMVADTLEDHEVSLMNVSKNNGVKLIGLKIMGEGDISPVIYLENYYAEYKDGKDMQDIENEILRMYSENSGVKFSFEEFASWDWVKDRVCFKLVSRERNSEFLEKVPHRPFLDLAMVYYVPIDVTGLGLASMVVYNEHLKMWDISEMSLNMRAKINTAKAMPSAYWGISEILHMPAPDKGEFMYIVSNKSMINGAAVLVYSEKFAELADKFDSDLIVIPSSVHEVMVVSSGDFNDIGELQSLVKSINSTKVASEEVLSDSVYKYSKETGSFKVVA